MNQQFLEALPLSEPRTVWIGVATGEPSRNPLLLGQFQRLPVHSGSEAVRAMAYNGYNGCT